MRERKYKTELNFGSFVHVRLVDLYIEIASGMLVATFFQANFALKIGYFLAGTK